VRDVVFVAIGGMLGALVRYGVGLLSAHWLGKGFPWGTLLVNVAGCFAMGMVLQVMAGLESRPVEAMTGGLRVQLAFWHKAVAIGFLGGLTTFSSFGGDALRTLQAGQPLGALANVGANVILSLVAVWCGVTLMALLD
jgi:CrcB protein